MRFFHQARAHSRMLEFSVGDRVSFHPEGREPLLGVLTRYNKKTVTVITEQGQRWNVSPWSATIILSGGTTNVMAGGEESKAA